MNPLSNGRTLAAKLHNDEEGMEALQTVLIIALGAIVLAFAYKIFGGGSSNNTDTSNSAGNTIAGWVGSMLKTVFGWK